MNPGLVGVLVFVGTAGAIYAGGQLVGTYFAPQNDVEVAATEQPLGLVPSVPDSAEADTDVAAEPETAESSETMVAAAPDASAPVDEPAATEEPPVEAPVLDIVRVEPTGETVIAGNAGQGTRIGLLYNDRLIADTEADVAGDFVLVPDAPIPAGEGTMEVVVLDEAGEVVAPSEEQVAVVLPEDGSSDGFLVSVLRPEEPVEIIEREAPAEEPTTEVEVAVQEETPAASETEVAALSEPAETVAEEAVTATEAPAVEVSVDDASPIVVIDAIELEGLDIWIAGAAEPGTVIRLYQDNALLGETLAGDEGRYLYEGSLSAATGTVTIRADALERGTANVVARAEVPFDMPGVEVAAATEAPTSDEASTESAPAEVAEQEAPAAETPAAEAPAVETQVTETAVEEAPAADPQPVEVAEAEVASEEQAAPAESAAEPASTPDAPAAAQPVEQAATDQPAETTTTEPAPAPVTTEQASAEPQQSSQQQATPQRISVLDTGRVIIRRGDNLWRLSRRVYGQGVRFTSIYDANRDQIRDPALIFPGQVFELPTPQPDWGEVPGFEALEPDQLPPAADATSETTSG
ncbi:MAG: LysM peptidoglycan-binding domain-containing protein [Pseudomonadota bacterium]